MKELKFRGLAVDGVMAYGYLAKDKEGTTAYWDEYSQRICWYPESGGSSNAPVKNGTVGQFVWMEDDEGKELYTGDIVCISGSGNCIVGMSPIHGVTYTCIADDALSTCANDVIAEQESIFLIGNIHENPELRGEK